VWNTGRGKPAIIELSIPKAEWKNFQADTKHEGRGAAYTTKQIPASWVKAVHPSTFYDSGEERVTIWLVVNLDEFADNIHDEFNPNEARDPHGRWTVGNHPAGPHKRDVRGAS